MYRWLVVLLTLVLPGCQAENPEVPRADGPAEAAPATLSFSNAFAPVAPEGGTGGVFVEIAGGATADTLVGAHFASAAQVEIHETYATSDGLRGMRAIEQGLPIPAGGTVALRPGSYHLMLMELRAPLAAGDTLEITLDFARAGTRSLRVPVRAPEDLPAHSAAHH